MNNILGKALLPYNVIHKIGNTMIQFDVERLHLKIKNGQHVDEFSDAIINLIDDLMEENHNNIVNNINNNIAYCADDFVKNIYESIARCFMDESNLSLEAKSWFCCNCGGRNFCKYIGGKMNDNTSICCLCGIQQIDSIMLNIKGYDTFIMVNDMNAKEIKYYDKGDDIDQLIQTALHHNPSIKLCCLNRNDNTPCPSFKRLAKHLIIYKRWINTVYQDTKHNNMDKTIQINVAESIDNKSYRDIFMNSAKRMKLIADNDMHNLWQMFHDNIYNIQNIQTFLNFSVMDFKQLMKNNSNIKPAWAHKLFKEISRSLKKIAATKQFGVFLSDLQMENIQRDYNHILKIHINDGNKESTKNAFRFFKTVVHYNDTYDEIKECKSCKRKAHRMHRNSIDIDTTATIACNNSPNKNIYYLQQQYNETQLDTIHSYLVHSKWEYYIQRYSDQPQMELQTSTESNATVINTTNAYGFGVEHSYPHLKDKYNSIHNELLCNTLYKITEQVFQNILIKSIKSHKVALQDYTNELICKYFHEQYNIIRNEAIGIRHIFALILYTDMSQFCTVFRATYRRINNETSDNQVTRRHIQLYHYSRSLFESVEFFGQSMSTGLKVYHGLDKVMYFERFANYFNQPMSTTTSVKSAQEFAREGGIILALKSGTDGFKDPKKIPKYLNVSWLSNFPQETEFLFYGAYVLFEIHGITKASNLSNNHANELKMFSKFQQILQNEIVEWNTDCEKEMLNALVVLIEVEKQAIFEECKQDMKEQELSQHSKYMSEYGADLFHYFCTNKKMSKITIKHFQKSLPNKLYKALFMRHSKTLSFIPITRLFCSLKEITLNDIDIANFTMDCRYYIDAVLEYIANCGQLNKIVFESKCQNDRKANTIVNNLARKNRSRFNKLHWKIEYDFYGQHAHILRFMNHNYIKTRSMASVEKRIGL